MNRMPLPRLLVVQTGTVAEPLRAEHGDYPAWFARALDGKAELAVIRAHEGERLGRAALDTGGIIITGSPLSVVAGERQPWMDDLGAALLFAGEKGTQILGVCFGQQLLCRAAGGEVGRNPRGREIGTIEVQLTEQGLRDPLFSWAAHDPSRRLEVQATHVDALERLPRGAQVLASNESSPAQAVRFGETIAGVQFHPELRPEALQALIAARAEKMRAEGLDPQKISAQVHKTPAGARILEAFADICRRS
jgi:GMP synthase (glutamine-hydrolysing)